jgi:hypothetical protein
MPTAFAQPGFEIAEECVMSKRRHSLMVLIAVTLIGAVASGCAGEIGVPEMSKAASPVQDVGQFNGTYSNQAQEKMGYIMLWQTLTHDRDARCNEEDLVKIEARSDGSFLAIHIVNGEEKGRKEISTQLKDGYLLSGTRVDVGVGHWVFVFVGDSSFGLALDANNNLVAVWNSGATLIFPLIFGADSGAPIRSTFIRRENSHRPKDLPQ